MGCTFNGLASDIAALPGQDELMSINDATAEFQMNVFWGGCQLGFSVIDAVFIHIVAMDPHPNPRSLHYWLFSGVCNSDSESRFREK